MISRFFRIAVLAGINLTLQLAPAAALWDGTVKIVVPYGPGGTNDVSGRLLAQTLTGALVRFAYIENKPGGGGVTAVNSVNTAPADGRTLLLSASVLEAQSAKQDPSYDISKDFEPVVETFEAPYVLYVNASLPINSLKDLVEYDKQHPGELSYASFGVGSGAQLAMELLKQRTGMRLVHVPYRSNMESLEAVLNKQVGVSLDSYPTLKEHIEAGTVRAIANTGIARDWRAPDLPTIDESGVQGFSFSYTAGILAPKGTPKQIIDEINKQINIALNDENVKAAVKRLGLDIVGGTSSRYQETLNKNIATLRKLILSANIKF